jgi:putative membrane protein
MNWRRRSVKNFSIKIKSVSSAMTTATAHIYADIDRNRLQQGLALWYLFFWVLTGISPLDRRDWLLENFLVVVFSGLLIATYRRFPLSDVSYVLIAIFLTLHSVGAHYTYAQVPIGSWAKDTFHLARNHYDRVVHFSFGLMLAYPARELFLRVANARGFWAYYLPLDVILALSAMYEIMESWFAKIIGPGLGDAWLGTQGDIWDSQNDMTCAAAGAIVCMAVTAMLQKRAGNRPKAYKAYN